MKQALDGLMKQARAGKPIPEDEIPAMVSTGASKPQTVSEVDQPKPIAASIRPAPQPPSASHTVSPAVSVAHPGTAPETAAKPRAIVQPVSSESKTSSGTVNVAKATLSAPSVSLHTGPASVSLPAAHGN